MRCHWWTNKETGERFVIPGCYGSLHRNDMKMCTCYKPVQKRLRIKDELTNADLISECDLLKRRCKDIEAKNKSLQLENADLLRRGLPIELKRAIERMDVDGEMQLRIFIKKLSNKKYG